MTQVDEVRGWIDRDVVDPSGNKVGTVSEIYVEDATERPAWAAVHMGLFGRRSSFVPIEGVETQGEALVIPWDVAQVKDAPQVGDGNDGHLTPADELQLYRHYIRQHDLATGADGAEDVRRMATEATERSTCDAVSDGTSDPATGSAGQGQTRLRKYMVTEEVRSVSRELVDDSPVEDPGTADSVFDAGRGCPGDDERRSIGGIMIIVGLVLIVAGAVFGIDVAAKNRFGVHDVEAFGSSLGLHRADQIFLLGVVTGAVILLGLALVVSGIRRSRSRRVAYRHQRRDVAETNQRAADLETENQRLRSSSGSDVLRATYRGRARSRRNQVMTYRRAAHAMTGSRQDREARRH